MQTRWAAWSGVVLVAMTMGGCCKRFKQQEIRELVRGDEAAAKVAWSLRLPDSVSVDSYAADSNAKGDIVIGASLGAEVEIGKDELPALDETAEANESSRPDLVVWKMDASGKPVWARRFGDSGVQEVEQIALDASGEVLVAASVHGSIAWGAQTWKPAKSSSTGAFVGKLDASGNPLWSAFVDTTPVPLKREPSVSVALWSAGSDDVSVDASGRVYLLGRYFGEPRFGGKPLVADVGETVSGNFLIAFDKGGAVAWHRVAAYVEAPKNNELAKVPTFSADARAVCVTPKGHSIVFGSAIGQGDFAGAPLKDGVGSRLFLSARDAEGNPTWTKEFAVEGIARPARIAAAPDGSLYVSGAVRGTVTFESHVIKSARSGLISLTDTESELFVARLDALGKVHWAKKITTVPYLHPIDLAVDPRGGFTIAVTGGAGTYGAPMDLGGGDLYAGKEEGSAMGAASYTDAGVHRWSKAFLLPSLLSNAGGAVTVTPTGRSVVVGTLGIDQCLITCEKEKLGDVFVAAIGP